MRNILILIAVVVFSLPAFAQSPEEAKVWARVDALQNAVFGTKDSIVIAELVGEKLTYGHSGGNIEDKIRMVHNAAVSQTIYKNSSIERLGLSFINKKTAIVRYIFRATSVEKGVEAPLNLSLLQVWAKEGGKWKLQARQAVKVNPK
jgi:hypothetical protein